MTSRFRILGRTRLLIGDQFDDQWAHSKVRGILAVLLLHPGRSVPMDVLIDWVWPDGKEPRDQTTLHTYKKRLVEALTRMAAPPRIVADRGAYRIEIDREDVDFFEFQAAVDRARALARNGDHEAVVGILIPALGLWSDVPLADVHGERAENWRQWAQSEHVVPAIEILLEALSALGRHVEALHRLDDLPVEQRQHHLLVKRRIEALRGSGRSAEAQALYLATRRQLRADSDDDSADALKSFYDNLLRDTRSQLATAHQVAVRPDPAPHLLPHDIPDFVGRDDLLAQLDTMATTGDHTGVAVLSGPPGVGKTALAVHWAHRITPRFPGGRLYADLGGFAGGRAAEPAEIVDEFLVALGFPVERVATPAGRAAKLRSLLAGRQVLVVLDNARTSREVLPLLSSLSTCLVLVTSRRRLGGLTQRGALSHTVHPLGFADAKRWLAHRLGDRAVSEPDATADLTAVCDGNPLALHGVADHVSSRPRVRLSEFVEELHDTDVLLGLGDDGDSPNASVRVVFSWSYQSLPPVERQMFRMLGVHPGPDIALDAAASLAGRDRASTKRLLDALVNSHLLNQPESRSRYRFHDLLRKYAADCGADPEYQDERTVAEIRLLTYYLYTANNADRVVVPHRRGVVMPPSTADVSPLSFTDADDAMDWCIRERANLSAIIYQSLRHGAHEYAIKLTNAAGEILQRVGYYDDTLAALSMAVQSARAIGDVESEGDTLCNLGFVYLNLRNFSSAEKCLRAALERCQTAGNQIGEAVVKHHLARLNVERGQFTRAIALYLESLAMLRRAEARGSEILALYRLGEAHRRAGNLDGAMSFCRDGLWLAEQLDDQHGVALCLGELGRIYYEHGDLTSAKAYSTKALGIHERLRDLGAAGATYNLMSIIHREAGDHPEAEDCSRKAVEYSHNARDSRTEAIAYDTLGYLLRIQARLDEAVSAWSKALTIFEDLTDPRAESVRSQLAEIADVEPRIPPSRTEPLTPERAARLLH